MNFNTIQHLSIISHNYIITKIQHMEPEQIIQVTRKNTLS